MKKVLFLTAALAALVSCNKTLDLTPTDRVSAKTLWETTHNAE